MCWRLAVKKHDTAKIWQAQETSANAVSGQQKGYSWKRRDATNSDKIHKIEKKIRMNKGTSACPESFTCKRAAIIKRKPIAEENNSLCAVDFELDWQENSTTPIKAQPAPIFFRNAIPTSIAS